MRAQLIALSAGALLSAASLTACSASSLDIDKLQTTIATEMQTQMSLSGTPTVTCPESVPVEQGNVFTCTAELDGDTIDVTGDPDRRQGQCHLGDSATHRVIGAP